MMVRNGGEEEDRSEVIVSSKFDRPSRRAQISKRTSVNRGLFLIGRSQWSGKNKRRNSSRYRGKIDLERFKKVVIVRFISFITILIVPKMFDETLELYHQI